MGSLNYPCQAPPSPVHDHNVLRKMKTKSNTTKRERRGDRTLHNVLRKMKTKTNTNKRERREDRTLLEKQ